VLFRLLRHLAKQGVWDGGKGETTVTYVRNITDVDDKINARAAERLAQRGEATGDLNAEIRRVTEETYANFKADVAALGCLPPTVEPRATEHIEEMKALIERLVASGHAYVAEDHVLFAVASMPDYGRLSKRPLDEMIAGARVEVAPYKRNAMDFVLWKPSNPDEPKWPSPCGITAPGRPGWHIECSAMSDHWLWTKAEPGLSAAGLAHPHQFDIHGGGVDLVFPHHENEIAQSRCGFHTPVMANYWMHNGFLMVEGEKMAKSLGNFITIREALERYDGFGLAIRYNMLRGHYRQPFDWTEEGMSQSINELNELWLVAADYSASTVDESFILALCDDLNTAAARACLFKLKDAANAGVQEAGGRLRGTLEWYGFKDLFVSDQIILPVPMPGDAASQLESIISSQNGNITVQEIEKGIEAAIISGELNGKNVSSGFWQMLRNINPKSRVREIRHIGASQHQYIYDKTAARLAARKAKNFKEADRIRDELLAMGIALKDSKDPETGELITNWEPV
jgi:cysteinyl-tRNA synthetase